MPCWSVSCCARFVACVAERGNQFRHLVSGVLAMDARDAAAKIDFNALDAWDALERLGDRGNTGAAGHAIDFEFSGLHLTVHP